MLKNSYILLGPEIGEKKEYISGIKNEIIKKYGDGTEEFTYYPYDTDMSEVIDTAEGMSMFSSFKIIIINDCSELKKKDIELFLQYLARPADDTVMIFTDQGTKADPKLEKAAAEKKIFWELDESRRKSFALNYFSRHNISLDQVGASLIAANSESNTLSVKNECDKLLLFFSDRKRLTGEEIEDFLFYNREENVFSLFDNILSGELEKTLDIAQNIMRSAEGAPIQLLAGLTWQFKRFLEFKTMLDDKYTPVDAFTKIGVRARKGQAVYNTGSRRYSTRETEQILSRCYYYDQLFRSVRIELQELYFPVFIYEIMAKKGKPSEESIFSSSF